MPRRFILLCASLFVLLATLACQVAGLPGTAATPTALPPATATPELYTDDLQSNNADPTGETVTLTLSENDIETLVTRPEIEQQFAAENLDVTFDDDVIELAADRLTYGPLTIEDFALSGTITAVDGRLRLDVARIQPNNLVTAAIPGILTRLLESRTAGYYVEDVEIDNGVMTIRVKP